MPTQPKSPSVTAGDQKVTKVRVTKRRGETRERLVAAAAAVFASKGFGRASVEDVCEAAGFSRGAFYSNFTSLDELFFVLYAERAAILTESVGSAVAAAVLELTGDVSSRRIDAVVGRVFDALPVTREHHLLTLEFTAHALRHPDVAMLLAEHRRRLREALAPILRTGLRAGGIDASSHEFDAAARAVMAVHDGMFVQELLEPEIGELPALRRRLMSVVVSAQAL